MARLCHQRQFEGATKGTALLHSIGYGDFAGTANLRAPRMHDNDRPANSAELLPALMNRSEHISQRMSICTDNALISAT